MDSRAALPPVAEEGGPAGPPLFLSPEAVGLDVHCAPLMHAGLLILLWVLGVGALQYLDPAPLLLAVALCAAAALALARARTLRLLRRVRVLLAAIVVLFAGFTPGEAVFIHWPALSPSREGLSLALTHASGLLAVVCCVALLLEYLPADRLIWWLGDEPLFNLEGGSRPQVTFTINSSEINAIRLAQLTGSASSATSFLDYSLYGLPLSTQQTYQVMIMIPIGVLVILILRNLGGLQTLGTFTPVLIALAFRETQLGFGILLFSLITALGLSLRSYLEHLKLQMLPRLSVVLTFVVVLIAVISLFSHKLGLERGLSISLFPMVILTMTIERLSITWEERGGNTAFKVAVGTLFAATLAHYLMSIQELNYFVFTFPGVLLVMVGFMLAMGRYRGYRLTELFRFKAFLKD